MPDLDGSLPQSWSKLAPFAPFLAEFVGTYILVVTFGSVVIGAPAEFGPTAIACALMALAYALRTISGGFLNPAIAIAAWAARRPDCSFQRIAGCCFVQLLAGILGGFTFTGVFGQGFLLGPKPKFSMIEVGVVEIIFTTLLCFVAISCMPSNKDRDEKQFFGLATGFAYIGGGYACGNISGACLNPAVSLAIYAGGGKWSLGVVLISYMAFQLIGALVAAALFRLMEPGDFSEEEDDPFAENLPVRIWAEVLGTCVLSLTAALNVFGGCPVAPWSVAATVLCLVYSIGGLGVYARGDVSGAHFNPAVTAAIVLSGSGGLDPNEGLAYIGAQLLGGMLGALLASCLQGYAALGLQPAVGLSWFAIAFVEAVFTGVYSLVVLSVVAVEQRKTDEPPSRQRFQLGLAMGFSVAAGAFAVKEVSGGILNPAIAFGFSAIDASHLRRYLYFFAYGSAELCGSALAATVFWFTRPGQRMGKQLPGLSNVSSDAQGKR